jgi:hypothetical protein
MSVNVFWVCRRAITIWPLKFPVKIFLVKVIGYNRHAEKFSDSGPKRIK